MNSNRISAADQIVEVMARAIWKANWGSEFTCEDDHECDVRDWLPEAQAALSALKQAGWRVVPIEPSFDQQVAGLEALMKLLRPDIEQAREKSRTAATDAERAGWSFAAAAMSVHGGSEMSAIYRAMLQALEDGDQ